MSAPECIRECRRLAVGDLLLEEAGQLNLLSQIMGFAVVRQLTTSFERGQRYPAIGSGGYAKTRPFPFTRYDITT